MKRARLILLSIFITGILTAIIYYGFIFDEGPELRLEWKKREATLGVLDTNLKTLAQEIQENQGESKCQSDGQCRVVGLGAKACNLYKDFLIYSVVDAKESKLLHFVREFNISHEKKVDLNLTLDPCGNKPAPIRCISDHCVPILN